MPVLRFIEPCLPTPADRPPSGTNWIYSNTGWQRLQRHSVLRALRGLCDRVGRANTPSRP